jgi:hypothetical protein
MEVDDQATGNGVVIEADDGGRTRDLRLGKPTLYQLSYVRVDRQTSTPPAVSPLPSSAIRHRPVMVGASAGGEP